MLFALLLAGGARPGGGRLCGMTEGLRPGGGGGGKGLPGTKAEDSPWGMLAAAARDAGLRDGAAAAAAASAAGFKAELKRFVAARAEN